MTDDQKLPESSGVFAQHADWYHTTVDLPMGRSGVRLLGDFTAESKQPLVLAVHGFSMPSVIWTDIDGLKGAPFRVMAPDLFGRSKSAWPPIPATAKAVPANTQFTTALVLLQLTQLLQHLQIEGKIHLMGYSMGGAVCAAFTQAYPERVASLAMLAPAGLHVELPWRAKLVMTPVLGDALYGCMGGKTLLKSMHLGYYHPENHQDSIVKIRGWVQEQLDHTPGFLAALLSTLRHFSWDQEKAFEFIGQSKLPVLLAWGDKDGLVSYDSHDKAQKLLGPRCEFVSFADASHDIVHEARAALSASVVRFFVAQSD